MATRRSQPTVIKTNQQVKAAGAMSLMLENAGDTDFNINFGGVLVLFPVGAAPLIFDEDQCGNPRDDIFNIEFVLPLGADPKAILWRDINVD